MSANPPPDPDEPQDGGRPGHGDEEPTQALGQGGEPTELASSPYDQPYGEDPTQTFGAAPSPGASPYGGSSPYGGTSPYGAQPERATTYSRPTYDGSGGDGGAGGSGDDGSGRGKGFVAAIIIGALVLIAAIVLGAMALFGDDDADPAPGASPSTVATSTEPSATATEDATETESPSDGATDGETATTEPSPSATTSGDLLRQLDESVATGDATFALTEAGFVPEPGVVEAGAVEAYTATYSDGENEIELLATAWPGVEEADAYAAEIVAGLEGTELIETGDTYANGTGTYWAYLLEDGRGMFLWTTDRGEVLRVTGPTDWVGPFYSDFSI